MSLNGIKASLLAGGHLWAWGQQVTYSRRQMDGLVPLSSCHSTPSKQGVPLILECTHSHRFSVFLFNGPPARGVEPTPSGTAHKQHAHRLMADNRHSWVSWVTVWHAHTKQEQQRKPQAIKLCSGLWDDESGRWIVSWRGRDTAWAL